MLKKDANVQWGSPMEEQVESFEELKESLASPSILGLRKTGGRFMVDTDASKYGLGALLLQEQDLDAVKRGIEKEGDSTALEPAKEWVTIGYWSKTLIRAEQNYSTTERECLSVVWALKTLRPYI